MDVEDLLQVMQDDMPRPALQAAIGLRNAEHFRNAYLVAGHCRRLGRDGPAGHASQHQATLSPDPLGLQRQRELKGNRP
jgi:hypothetical protein